MKYNVNNTRRHLDGGQRERIYPNFSLTSTYLQSLTSHITASSKQLARSNNFYTHSNMPPTLVFLAPKPPSLLFVPVCRTILIPHGGHSDGRKRPAVLVLPHRHNFSEMSRIVTNCPEEGYTFQGLTVPLLVRVKSNYSSLQWRIG